ncbi:MAG: glycogen synthase [Sandaracinaceae bacterium]
MRVLFVAVEAAPWIKVGGLADVIGSLPRALRDQGVDARVCLPAHAGVMDHARGLQIVARFGVPHVQGSLEATIYETTLGGVPTYLVSGPPIPPHELVYTARMDEEGHRFTFFSIAALELAHRHVRPDVIHAHDWHAALSICTHDFHTLLTVHNLPYAGRGAEGAMAGFDKHATFDPRVPEELRGAPLAIGLVAAERISTVSEGYAREILTPELGAGLEGLLRSRRADLTGILNGLDIESWDPMRDAGFDASTPDARRIAEAKLRAELGFPQDRVPLIAVVSRLVPQKGVDLALEALRALERPHYAVFLGTGEPALEQAILELEKARPGQVRARIGFDDALARRIYAGADFLLLPSRYEPCGMTQMIGMRYGCVPIARETGGLADTVFDVDLSDRPTGILFPDASVSSTVFALRRALALYARPDGVEALRRFGMTHDFSWRRSAADYVSLYRSLAGSHRAERPGEGMRS